MKTLKNFTTILLCYLCIGSLQSQEESTNFYSMDYMMVEPGMHDDYRACEKAWKKIHAQNKENGRIESWTLMQIVSPRGSSMPYNYVTRVRFKDRHQMAAYQDNPIMPDNWKSLLTADEIALVDRTSELRTYVKNEILSLEERILADDISDVNIAVVNFFKMPKGVTRADHLKMERDLWMPFHKHGVEKGNIKGWVMMTRALPIGTDYSYDVMTVDLFKDMGHFWEPFDEAGFTQIHAGKSMDDIMEETAAAGSRGKTEIRRRIDGLRN